MSEEKFKFHEPVKVRYSDTDLQGRVYFGAYYDFFDEGIEGYLAAIGYSYAEMLRDEVDFTYIESHCNYKSSAEWPEILNVHTRIGYMGRRSLRFEFQIYATSDQRLVCLGHIAAVTSDKVNYQPCPVPAAFREAVTAYEGHPPSTER